MLTRLLLLFAGAVAWAQPQVTITHLEGPVQVVRNNTTSDAGRAEPLRIGDQLNTNTGRAGIQLGDRTLVVAEASTTLLVDAAGLFLQNGILLVDTPVPVDQIRTDATGPIKMRRGEYQIRNERNSVTVRVIKGSAEIKGKRYGKGDHPFQQTAPPYISTLTEQKTGAQQNAAGQQNTAAQQNMPAQQNAPATSPDQAQTPEGQAVPSYPEKLPLQQPGPPSGKKQPRANSTPPPAGDKPPKHGNAVPLIAQMDTLSTGNTITFKAPCHHLSHPECGRQAHPIQVLINRSGNILRPDFDIDAAFGQDSSLVLTLKLGCRSLDCPGETDHLGLGDLVAISYGDKEPRSTDWWPVMPGKDQIDCCYLITQSRRIIKAGVPITLVRSVPYLKDGSQTPIPGYQGPDGWWYFQPPPNVDVSPGDNVSISAYIHGAPVQFVKDTLKYDNYQAPMPPPAAAPAPAPAAPPAPVPTANTKRPPFVAPTGTCNIPLVDPSLQATPAGAAATVSVTLPKPVTCVLTDLSNLVLFIDNQPVTSHWVTSENPYSITYQTPVPPLLPFQRVKALLFSPAQAKPDSPDVRVAPNGALPVLLSVWWVANPSAVAGGCAPPNIAGTVFPGTSFFVQVNCANVNPNRLYLFIDNVQQHNVTWTQVGPQLFAANLPQGVLQPYQRIKVLQIDPVQNDPDSAVVTVAAPAAAPTPAPITVSTGACAAPYMPNPPGADDSITVVLGCLPTSASDELTVYIDGQLQQKTSVVWSEQSGISPITFTAKLPSKLTPGQTVKVKQQGQRDPDSPVQTASAPPKPPTTIFSVHEGDTTVSGVAQGLDKVRAQIIVDGDVKSQPPDASVDTNGNFSVNVGGPLQSGEELKLFGISKSGKTSEAATPIEVQPFGLDWGSVRGYFTAGIILSSNNSQFNVTNANAFLGFNIDKSWLRPIRPLNAIGGGARERFGFHTFFDARLTAIPSGTNGSTSATTPTLSSGNSGTTGTTGTGASSTTATGNPSPNPTSLLSNGQAAALQVGAYFPMTLHRWDYKGRSYGLFVAPIAKVGFYTLTSAGSSAAEAAENNTRSNGRFFPFYSYGVRIGHYRDFETWDGRLQRSRSFDLLSFLDISVGKWANLEYLAPFNFSSTSNPQCNVPATDPTTAACDTRERLWRYNFEGLLVIPNTPLVLGVNANLASWNKPRSVIPGQIFFTPPDDLRFLFGVRFDASKFTGLLNKISGQ
jgi:hypothetical protein